MTSELMSNSATSSAPPSGRIAFGIAGWSYADLLRAILEAAKARIAAEAQKPVAAGPDPAQLELALNGAR